MMYIFFDFVLDAGSPTSHRLLFRHLYLSTTSHSTMEHPAFTLSALCSIGGIMGYMRKGSLPSLIGGVAVGSLYGISGYLLRENANGGLETALLASALLLGAGLPRAIRLRKPVPIGISVLALVSLGYYGKKWSDFNL